MRESFSGWGRTAPSVATRSTPAGVDELAALLAATNPERGILTRGLGRSYGDAAQNAGGTIIDLRGWDRVIDIDIDAATLTVQSGVSIDVLMRMLLPMRLWLPVLPGTRQVTIGGAISADVHGKNHHVSGSFGSHVRSLSLMMASGELLTLSPDGEDADLFWATVGGMGLTGVITEATIGLKRVETSSFVVDTVKVPHIRPLLDVLSSGDDRYEYSVAWFDTATTGDSLGRAVVTRGHSARRSDLDDTQREHALDLSARQVGSLPITPPNGLVNRLSARAFNALWYAKAPAHRDGEIQSITQFFHPLDVVGDWNRVYGSRGFCQYQFVVPFGAEEAFIEAVTRIASSAHVSSLNVLKRFGSGNASPLSFPMPGWTVAVDFPMRDGLGALLDGLDELVIAAGGRVYLAKDSRLSRRSFDAMYARAGEFRAIRDRIDPDRLFQSDLARRLML